MMKHNKAKCNQILPPTRFIMLLQGTCPHLDDVMCLLRFAAHLWSVFRPVCINAAL